MKKQSAGRRVRGEKIRRKKMQVREKVGKSRNTVFFSWFCKVAPEGWKVGSLKRRGAETSGEMRNQKLHAVVARSRFRSEKVQNTLSVGPLLEVEMLKKCTPLWREAHFEVKMLKTPGVRTTLGGSDVASLHYTTLQDITLHYTPVHYITLHYTPVHSTTLNYTTPHYIALNDAATQIDR